MENNSIKIYFKLSILYNEYADYCIFDCITNNSIVIDS